MHITVDPTAATPPYDQIRQQVIDLARSGKLTAGTRLPTVRALAADLDLAPNTVARAYRELESINVIETRGRHGTFITWSPEAQLRQAQQAAHLYAQRIRDLGITAEQALRIAKDALLAQ